MAKLAEVSGVEIKTFADVVKALYNRIDFFNEMGCRASDHALDYAVYAAADEAELDAIVARAWRAEPSPWTS